MKFFFITNIPRKTTKAFTLLETLIVIAIFAVLMTVLTEFYLGYNKSFAYIQAKMDVTQSASLIVNAVVDSAKQADQISSSHSFSGINYTSNGSALVLELPSVDDMGTIITSKFDYLIFYINGTSAYEIIDPDASSSRTASSKLLSDSVQSLSFTYDNQDVTLAKKVDIQVQIQKQVKGQTVQSDLHQQIYLRNK